MSVTGFEFVVRVVPIREVLSLQATKFSLDEKYG